jgi:hypothetical protein
MKVVNLVDTLVDWLNDNPMKTLIIVVILLMVFKTK